MYNGFPAGETTWGGIFAREDPRRERSREADRQTHVVAPPHGDADV